MKINFNFPPSNNRQKVANTKSKKKLEMLEMFETLRKFLKTFLKFSGKSLQKNHKYLKSEEKLRMFRDISQKSWSEIDSQGSFLYLC